MQNGAKPSHEIVTTLQTQSQQQKAHTDEQRTIEDRHDGRERRKFWLDLAGVVGLWIAAGVGVGAIYYGTTDADRQRGVMQRQLDEMKTASADAKAAIEATNRLGNEAKRQADLSERALVTVNRAVIGYKEIKRTLRRNAQDQVIGWVLEPWIANYGNTIALHFVPYDRLFRIPPAEAAAWQPINVDPTTLHERTPIPPKGTDGLTEIFISNDQINAQRLGLLHNVICIWAFYKDVYRENDNHHLRMCFAIRANTEPDEINGSYFVTQFGEFDLND